VRSAALGYTSEHRCVWSQWVIGYRSQLGTWDRAIHSASTMHAHAPPPGFTDGLSTRSSEPADSLLQ